MECVSAKALPTTPGWTYEIKLDGYRLQAHRLDDRVVPYSRRGNVKKFPEIEKELEQLQAGTILDGELTALDDAGQPRFNLLQNYRTGAAHLAYFVFDILLHKGRDVTRLPLSERRSLFQSTMKRGQHVEMTEWTTDLEGIESFVREHKLEGIIAKRSNSLYESGRRSGTWVKMRLNSRQEFVIGGYTPSHLGLDAVLVGFYQGKELRFAGSVRAGFNPQTRREVHDQIKDLEILQCPFTNLPDKRPGLWGQGITAAKMKDRRWLKPTAVAEIEFAEWTPGDRLRSASFISLRDDKNARRVVKET
jgi:bifunctional non-homologous end joining protein LigD